MMTQILSVVYLW